MPVSDFEAQAEYFANIPILDRKYRSSVHLESETDEMFWDTMLQAYRPGNYYYIYYSKNAGGNVTRGCEQCLKYKGLLSKNFFICIDSDLRYLQKEKDIDSRHFILQTYCYSWENHYCFSDRLQSAWEHKCPELSRAFNISRFIKELSLAIYEEFLHFLIMNKRGFKEFTLKRFNDLLPQQYSSKDMLDNGKNFVEKVKQVNSVYVDTLEKKYYLEPGLNEENVYLHIRGHFLYNLINYIGKSLCRKSQVDFEKEVLLAGLQTHGYWEVDKIGEDIENIL